MIQWPQKARRKCRQYSLRLIQIGSRILLPETFAGIPWRSEMIDMMSRGEVKGGKEG